MTDWNALLALPEWILAATTMVALVIDARTPAGAKRGVYRTVVYGIILATFAVAVQGMRYDEKQFAFLGHYGVDSFSIVFKLLFGLTGLFVLTMAESWLRRVDRGQGEFYMLSVMATLGMFFLASAEDFAILFVSLELITVSFYCLTAFKRNDERSVEAGVKYVVLGSIASSFMILGIGFVYGATGSLSLADLTTLEIARDLGNPGGALVQFGVLLTLVGVSFKIAAVPFQLWVPDVYEGAASPVTAFLSMGSKAAGVVLLLKIVRACMGPGADAGLAATASWIGLFALVAAVTVLYGNLGAMWQGNIKRLLGYSSIGHAGYILMGVVAFDEAGFAAIVYYVMAYLFTVLGVFSVVVVVGNAVKSHRIDDYAGLGRRSPMLALVMTACLLSLAGVPPLGGFFGKFLIFWAIVGKNDPVTYALAFVGAAGVVISLYYYLCVVKRLYMHEPEAGGVGGQESLPVSGPMWALMWVCLAGVFVMGVFPRPFMDLAESAARAFMALG